MAINGKDIYNGIGEYFVSDDYRRPTSYTIWKNGQKIYTIPGEAGKRLMGISASDNDVYVALIWPATPTEGNNYRITIWKNGAVLQTLDYPLTTMDVNAVCFHNGDLYAAGYRTFADGSYKYTRAAVWKTTRSSF